MRNYVIRRVLFLFMVIWTAATINFVLPRLSGRDPIREQMLQQIASQGRSRADAELMINSYTKIFGLDKPLWQQYVTYLSNALRFNFGYSINNYPRTVMEIIIARGRLTMPFLIVGIFIAFVLGILLGAFLGWDRTPQWLSNLLMPPLLVFGSIPQFVVALVLIYFVSFRMRLLPMSGAYPRNLVEDWTNLEFVFGYAKHAILPVLCIVIVEASSWALGMRAMMVTVQGEDYATFAEARGLKKSRIFLRYLLRNALLPSLTGLAIRLGFIITGASVAETYFAYNGLGNTLGAAIGNFDYFLLYGIVIFMVASIAFATFVMDMIYPLLDPRITYRAQKG
ncbi:MAG: ABC transporter permease [Chloroflexota bacterium]